MKMASKVSNEDRKNKTISGSSRKKVAEKRKKKAKHTNIFNARQKKKLCNICGQYFYDTSNLNRHKKTIHPPGVEKISVNISDLLIKEVCDICGRFYYDKSNLKRHKKQIHERPAHMRPVKLIVEAVFCDYCGGRFYNKSNLQRHIVSIHGSNKPRKKPKQNVCNQCGRQFYDQSNLKRHIKTIHTEETIVDADLFEILSDEFICKSCNRSFVSNLSLQMHERSIHGRKRIPPPKKIRKPKEKPKELKLSTGLLCDQCGQSFSYKTALIRHEKYKHSESTQDAYCECATCGQRYRRKDALLAHIQRRHFVDYSDGQFKECAHCSKKFFHKTDLRKHIITVHMLPKKNTGNNWKCLKCDQFFKRASTAKEHYKEVHDIKMQYESLEFKNMDEFYAWKKNVQRKLVTQFVQQFSWKTSNCVTYLFCCHRSGMYADKSRGERRRRTMKRTGSKKLQGYCPAEIQLKIGDNICRARFQSTHVGHAINTSEELRHIYLDKDQKLNIAAKLRDGVPCSEVLKQLNLSNGLDESLNRLSITNYADVYNIARNLDVENRFPVAFRSDATNLESFVFEKKDAILYYKAENETDSRFAVLERTDFAIVLLDPLQQNSLMRYAGHVVAFDSAQDTQNCNFVLHAMLVADVNYVEIPVAFLLTNRNDRPVIDVFLQCIRDRVGVVETETLVSNMRSVYVESWSAVMVPPQRYLYCSWRVNETWRRNLNKILDKRKKAERWRMLQDLATEMTETAFREKLNAFVAPTDDDDDVRSFLKYFRKYFYENAAQWAYCYRKHSGACDNLHIDGFRRVLRQNIIANRKKTLFDGLKHLEEYLIIRENERVTKELRGGHSRRRDNLQKNHRRAVEVYAEAEVPVVCQDDDTWQIISVQKDVSDVVIMELVEKIKPKQCSLYEKTLCQLVCEKCRACQHEYKCSCVDSAVHLNMCEHIHMLGIYLQQKRQLAFMPNGTSTLYENEDADNLVDPSVLCDSEVDSETEEKMFEQEKLQILEKVEEALNCSQSLSM